MAKKVETMKSYKVIAELKSNMGKSVEEKQIEKAIDDLEDLIIEVQAQIAHIKTSRIPAAENKVIRSERDVAKAKKALEEQKYKITNDITKYVDGWKSMENEVLRAQAKFSMQVLAVQEEKDALAKYTEMLEFLTAVE